MRTDDLIIALARSAGPVTPLPRPSIRAVRWTVFSIALAGIGVLLIGPRVDLMSELARPAFFLPLAVLLAAAPLAAAATLVSSVPGAEGSPLLRSIAVVAALAWPAAWLGLLFDAGPAMPQLRVASFHWACAIEIVVLSMTAGWALLMMARRAAPVRPTWTATVAALAAVTISAAATQIICPISAPGHQVLGHVIPGALAAIAGVVIGRRSITTPLQLPGPAPTVL